MATYKPITMKQYSPSSVGTGGASGGVSLVPYSSPQAALEAQAKKSGVGVIGRTVATFGDLTANILSGAAKALEGITDFTLTSVGAVGGIFSDEFQNKVRRLVEYDFVGEHIADPLQELTGSSYLNVLRIGEKNVGQTVEQIAQGIGNLIPSLVLAYFTGGSSLAAQIASMASLATGAAGNATEEAMNSGAGYGSAAAYGLSRGVIEGATEYIGGVTLGGGTSLIGKKLAGTTLGKATKKGVGKVAYNFISEGAEEVLSDLTDPLAKYATGVDKNVGENYGEVFKGLPQTFLVGGSVGTVVGAGQTYLASRSKNQQARGGAAAVRADFYLRDAMEMSANYDKMDGAKVSASILSSYEGVSQQLKQMDAEKRGKYLESIGVHKLAFDADTGDVVAKAAENVNAEAVSDSLRAVSGNLAHAPIAANVEVSESAKTARETVMKALGKNANVVVTDALADSNAVYNPDEDVIYISNGAMDGSSFNTEDVARAVALHEVAHKAEGTKAYLAMADELLRIAEDENAPDDVKALLGDREARLAEMSELYSEDAQNKNQEKYIVKTELVANMLADLLGNSYFVERMGARNDSAWKRFIMALKAADMGKAAGVSKETQKYLSGLYKSYVKAVDNAGSGVNVSSIVDEREKEKAAEGAASDKNVNMRYSLSKNAKAELHKALYDTSYRSEVKLRDVTPDIMISQKDVKNLPMAMNASHIRENVFTEAEAKKLGLKVDDDTHYHGLGEEFFLKIIDGLDDVTEAYRGTKYAEEPSRREDYFLLVSKFKDSDGDEINVPVYINEYANHNRAMIDANKISTVFGRDGFRDYIRNQIRKKNLVRVKNRSTQAGERSALIAEGYGMDASTNSIPQNSEKSTENPKKVSDERKSKKVYLRAEASAALEETVKELFVFTDAYASLKGKSKKEATDILWKALNTAEDEQARERAALNVADFVLDNMAMETLEANQNVQKAADTIAALKPYYHKLDLDGVKTEIKKRFGKETSPYLLWGKQNGKATVDLETVFAELSKKEIFLSSTDPAEIFFEIYDMDKKAKGVIEENANTLLKKSISTEEREGLRKKISKDILQAYEEKGAKTIDFNLFHRKLASAEGWAEYWKKRYLNEVDRHRITNRILDKARRLDDIKKGAFMSATQSRVWIEKFKGSIFRLSQIRFLGNLNTVGTRRICARLETWYTDENNELVKNAPHLYDKEIAVVLKELARNERTHTEAEDAILDSLMTRFKTSDLKKLHELYTAENLGKEYDANVKLLLRELSSESIFDKEELVMLERVVDYFAHFAEKFNLVYRAGKYVKASDLARGYIQRFTERGRGKPGTLRKWFEGYYVSFGDPMALARYMDSYDKHGFFTETLEEIRRAGIDAAVREMKIRAPLEKFYKENPKFLGNLKNKRVKDWNKTEIPLANAISLYMTLGREQAIKGLARKGYVIQASKDAEKVRLQGFMPLEEIADDQLAAAAKEARDNLYKQFTEDEKTFIGLVEAAFEECKKVKYDTDMIRHGYSNVIAGYYFPIARAYVSHSIDSFKYQDEMDAVSSKSFNKDTVTGAEGELFINAVDAIFNRHVRGVTQYAEFSLMVDTFDALYSLNVNETPGKAESIATESEKVWGGSKAYFEKLVRDVQGLRTESKDTLLDKLLPTIRSGYAKYLLGANPKVWVTQLSSLAASTSILDVNCVVKGLSMSAKDVDQYCALAQLRNTDNTAALAQGVLENVSGFGDVLMKPIGMVDRFVIERLFAACQVQVNKNGTAELGTEENKVAAGKLLEKVILETQQNSLASERSAAMRSENEINKTITMFSADAMKVFGRVVDAYGEVQTLRRLLKLESDKGDAAKVERYQKELKRAGKKLARSVSALLSSAVMMALIAQLVRRLLNKKDKDEAVENIVADTANNLIGGLPLIRDVASFFTDGYDIDYYAFSAVNDLLGSVSDIFELGQDAMSGEWDSQRTAKAVRSAFYSAGTVLGVPTRNIYNYSYAAINLISPETGYKMDDLFYSKSYRADLAKAIEKGDDGMVATIAGLMLDDGVGGMKDKALRQAMRDLIAAGYDVVPKSVKSSFTYEGEVYELNAKQKKAFEATYMEAHEEAARLVKLSSFASAGDEVKAKALVLVYDLYYDMAIHERVGDGELGKSALFAAAIDVPALALAAATAKSFESDKDKDGKTVAGSLKKKVHAYVNSLKLDAAQKYMLMGYLGYKNAVGEDKVKAYIRTLKLTDAQKTALLEASGY